jgi:hypothetical protein
MSVYGPADPFAFRRGMAELGRLEPSARACVNDADAPKSVIRRARLGRFFRPEAAIADFSGSRSGNWLDPATCAGRTGGHRNAGIDGAVTARKPGPPLTFFLGISATHHHSGQSDIPQPALRGQGPALYPTRRWSRSRLNPSLTISSQACPRSAMHGTPAAWFSKGGTRRSWGSQT